MAEMMPPLGGIVLSDSGLLGTSSFIDGAFSRGGSRGSVPVVNPANNGIVARVAAISTADLTRCVDGADRAFHGAWCDASPRERARLLLVWHALVEHHAADLATILTLENGKPLAEARSELRYAGDMMDWAAGEAVRAHGSTATDLGDGLTGVYTREPIGVALLITPWSMLANACLASYRAHVSRLLTCVLFCMTLWQYLSHHRPALHDISKTFRRQWWHAKRRQRSLRGARS
jgi:delta 1-pyrroline-5-carboxylate dehydrogenase